MDARSDHSANAAEPIFVRLATPFSAKPRGGLRRRRFRGREGGGGVGGASRTVCGLWLLSSRALPTAFFVGLDSNWLLSQTLSQSLCFRLFRRERCSTFTFQTQPPWVLCDQRSMMTLSLNRFHGVCGTELQLRLATSVRGTSKQTRCSLFSC